MSRKKPTSRPASPNRTAGATARARILAAAQAVYAREGYAGFSMRKVAAKAGLSTMASYRYFPDKQHLLHALVVHGFALFAQGAQPLREIADPFERLRRAFDHFKDFSEDHLPYFEIMFMATDELRALKPVTPEGAETMSAVFLALRDGVIKCGVPPEDAIQEAVSILAHAHGLLTLQMAGRLGWIEDFDQCYAREMDRCVAALRARIEAAGHAPLTQTSASPSTANVPSAQVSRRRAARRPRR